MTKQEIEQAIENGKSVWYIVNNELAEIDLSCNFHEIKDNELLTWYDKYSKDYYTHKKKLEDLYKSQAEAEHYLHHANVERVEKLPFLTWEEFKEGVELSTTAKNGEKLKLYIGLIPDDSIYYMYMKLGNKQQNVGEATEANFYKAYDECVRLFRGDE